MMEGSRRIEGGVIELLSSDAGLVGLGSRL